MNDGRAWDDELRALHARLGSVEGEQIKEAAKAKHRDYELTALNDVIYRHHNEIRSRLEKIERLVEGLAAQAGII